MWRTGKGFTLLEVLISTTLFSIVFAGVYLLYATMQGMMSRGELMSDLQQNARVGLDKMVQEIRMAGYDPQGAIPLVALAPNSAIRAASSSCFSFVGYTLLHSTNPPTEKSKQITYSLSGTTMYREEDSWDGTSAFTAGTAQPQAMVVNSLTFLYYTANNQILVPYSWTSTQRCPPTAGASAQSAVQLDFWQMRQVKRVVIQIQTRDSRPNVVSEFFTLSSDVFFRNL